MAGDESGTTLGQPHLARQDLNSLVSATLTSVKASGFLHVGRCRFPGFAVSAVMPTAAGAASLPSGT